MRESDLRDVQDILRKIGLDLGSQDPAIRWRAATRVARLGSWGEADLVQYAADAVADLGEASLEYLVCGLSSEEPSIAELAHWGFILMGASAAPAIPGLLQQQDSYPVQIGHALVAIGEAALPAIRKSLSSASDAARLAVVHELGPINALAGQLIPELLPLLDSSIPELRAAVVEALAEVSNLANVRQRVATLQSDDDPRVRESTRFALELADEADDPE